MPFTNKHVVPLETFEGGRNTKANTANVPLNQSPDELNMVYDDYGAVKIRAGQAKYNQTSIATYPIDGLFSYKPATMSAQLLVGCADKILVLTGTATAFNTINSAVSIFTNGVLIDILQFQDLAIFSNGNVQPYKFNGNEFTRLGVSAPTQSITAVCNGAGNLNGTYVYAYTGVNSYLAEGDYGALSTAVAITSGAVLVGNIPTAPASHGINTWNVYRNSAGVQGTYWLVTSVTNGVTAFTDNVADGSLVTKAPTDQGYPRLFKYMVQYQGRFWIAGDSNKDFLWFSNINQPEEFPSTNFIRVGKGDGLDISGLAILSGNIVINKSDQNGRTAVYLLFIGDSAGGSEAANWTLIKADTPQGSDSHRALINYSDSLLMLNRNGVYSFAGRGLNLNQSETKTGTLAADAISFDIEPDIQALAPAYLSQAATIDWKNKIWMSVTASGETLNDTMFVFDYVRASNSNRKQGAWSKFDQHRISKMAIHEGKLLGGGSGSGGDATKGYIYQLDTGFDDDTGTINAHFSTGPIKGNKQHEGLMKDWRWAYITLDVNSSDTLQVSHSVDFSDFVDDATYSLTASSNESVITIKHKFALGDSESAGGAVRATGRSIQLRFTTSSGYLSDASVTIRRVEVYYTIRGLR